MYASLSVITSILIINKTLNIDFRHRWKMVHYFAKNFFAPILISPHLSNANHLSIFTLSDITEIIPNATLTMSVYNWDKIKPIHEENITLNIVYIHVENNNIFPHIYENNIFSYQVIPD